MQKQIELLADIVEDVALFLFKNGFKSKASCKFSRCIPKDHGHMEQLSAMLVVEGREHTGDCICANALVNIF